VVGGVSEVVTDQISAEKVWDTKVERKYKEDK